MCVLGVEASEKNCGPPRIISGTALSLQSRSYATMMVMYVVVVVLNIHVTLTPLQIYPVISRFEVVQSGS